MYLVWMCVQRVSLGTCVCGDNIAMNFQVLETGATFSWQSLQSNHTVHCAVVESLKAAVIITAELFVWCIPWDSCLALRYN